MRAAQASLGSERRGISIVAGDWWLVALRGVASIVFGLLAIVWPGLTLLVLVWLFGIYAAVDGVFNIVSGVRRRRRDWMLVLLGAAGIAAGVIAIVWPGMTALVLVLLIGAWALVTGVLETAAAIRRRGGRSPRWLLMLTGLVSVAFGLLVVLRPGAGALALVLVIGAYALLSGGILLVAAYQLRALHDAEQAAGSH